MMGTYGPLHLPAQRPGPSSAPRLFSRTEIRSHLVPILPRNSSQTDSNLSEVKQVSTDSDSAEGVGCNVRRLNELRFQFSGTHRHLPLNPEVHRSHLYSNSVDSS